MRVRRPFFPSTHLPGHSDTPATLMKPIAVLINEHRVIEQVLNCLERMAEQGQQHSALDERLARDAVGFFRAFVHGWHFPREEAYLACAMHSQREAPPEDLRFHDHQRCGQYLRAMEQAAAANPASDPDAVEHFVENAQAFITLLMTHNEDEEDRVFPTVQRILTKKKESEAIRAMRHAESQALDRRGLDACIAVAHRLADHFNVPRAVTPVSPQPR